MEGRHITIREDQSEFIDKHNIDLSAAIRDYLDRRMAEHDESRDRERR